MRAAAISIGLVFISCAKDRLVDADGALVFAPPSIVFGAAWVGLPAQASTALTYASGASCDVTLSATPPFALSQSTAHLEGATASTVAIALTATAVGVVTGSVTATGCGHSVTASITATISAVPDCGAARACATFAFDADAGACVATRLPDGTACTNACLTSPTCRSGVCLGEAIDCADDDPCTVDTCSPATGCGHLDGSGLCPPLAGCGGACDGGDCGTLSELWSITTTAASVPWQPAVADDDGNLYWVENAVYGPGAVVSYDLNGALRFRTPVDLTNVEPRPMLVGNVFSFSGNLVPLVFGFRTTDGAHLYTRDLQQDLIANGHPEAAGQLCYTDHGTIGANGELVYAIAFTDLETSWFFGLDPTTGATLWRTPFTYGFWEIQGDEAGNLYVQVTGDNSMGFHLAAYDHAGGFLWRSDHFPGPTTQQQIFSQDAVLSAATGQPTYAFTGMAASPEVVLPTWAMRRDVTTNALEVFDPANGHIVGSMSSMNISEWDVLASADDELLGVDYPDARLFAIRPDASVAFTCHVPDAPVQTTNAEMLIARGHLFLWTQTVGGEDLPPMVTLHAYAFPGRDGATHGWLAPGGSMARTNRAR